MMQGHIGTRSAPRVMREYAGFTLIEVVLGISILLVATLALGMSLQAGAMAARQMREEQVIVAEAQTYVDRLLALEFGHTYDADPSAAQLQEVFDADANPGNITLDQLSRYPAGDNGWKFSLSSFPVAGEWRVRVDRDLNDNGLEDGDLEIGQRVFRISVFFNDRLILQTNRAKEVTL